MRIALCSILAVVGFSVIAQDIRIQYATQNVRNGRSDAGYTYDFTYNLIATHDSVFVFSENLEFGFSHSYNPDMVVYYHLGYSNDLTERKWKKSLLKPQSGQITKTGNTKQLLGYTCEEYVLRTKDIKATLFVTQQLPFRTLAYYPLFFGMSQEQYEKINFLLGGMDGAVLELRMGNDINYTSVQATSLTQIDAEKNPEWFKKGFISDKLPKSYTKAFISIKHKPLKEGDQAPAFSLALTDGQVYNPDDWKDYVKVYDFWGIWCPGCVAEIPALNLIWNEFKDERVKFIAFTNDHTAVSANYQKKRPFDFEIAPNADWIMRKFGTGTLPVTFIVSKDNVILYRMDDTLIEKALGAEKYEKALTSFREKIREALNSVR